MKCERPDWIESDGRKSRSDAGWSKPGTGTVTKCIRSIDNFIDSLLRQDIIKDCVPLALILWLGLCLAGVSIRLIQSRHENRILLEEIRELKATSGRRSVDGSAGQIERDMGPLKRDRLLPQKMLMSEDPKRSAQKPGGPNEIG